MIFCWQAIFKLSTDFSRTRNQVPQPSGWFMKSKWKNMTVYSGIYEFNFSYIWAKASSGIHAQGYQDCCCRMCLFSEVVSAIVGYGSEAPDGFEIQVRAEPC